MGIRLTLLHTLLRVAERDRAIVCLLPFCLDLFALFMDKIYGNQNKQSETCLLSMRVYVFLYLQLAALNDMEHLQHINSRLFCMWNAKHTNILKANVLYLLHIKFKKPSARINYLPGSHIHMLNLHITRVCCLLTIIKPTHFIFLPGINLLNQSEAMQMNTLVSTTGQHVGVICLCLAEVNAKVNLFWGYTYGS